MKNKEEIRFYFKLISGQHTKFLHIIRDSTNFKIIPSGLNSKLPKFLYRWEGRQLSKEDITYQRYNWSEMDKLDIPGAIESISFHPIGKCFRFKFQDGKTVEEKLAKSLKKGYIDVLIISHLPKCYTQVAEVKGNYIVLNDEINRQDDVIYIIRGAIAVNNHDVRKHPYIGRKIAQSHTVPGFAYFEFQKKLVDDNNIKKRPKGTVLCFLFHEEDDFFSSKGFIIG